MNNRQLEERKHEIRVAITILIGIAIIIFVIFAVGDQQGLLRERYRLFVQMSRVNGLQPGAPVRLNGVHVGTVTGVDFSQKLENQKIQIELEIFREVQERIRQDSKAHIGTLGLLGDKFVGITMGHPEHRVLKDGDELEGADPVDIELLVDESTEALSLLKKAAENLNNLSQKMTDGEGTIGKLLNESRLYFTLDTLLTDLVGLSKKLNENRGISTMIKDSTFFFSLTNLMKNSNDLVDSLISGKSTMSKLLYDEKFYDETMTGLHELNALLENVNSGEGTLGQLAKNKELYMHLVTVTMNLDSLIKDLKENPHRYIKVELF